MLIEKREMMMTKWIGAAMAMVLAGGCSQDVSIQTEQKMNMESVQSQKNIPTLSFEAEGVLAKSLPEISEAVQRGEISAEALVNAYLKRIKMVDQSGPTLQSILTLNPDALAQARALDAKLAAGEALGPLHGVPVVLKDNIETSDKMPTTAGALALADNFTGRDAPLAKGLRDAGAIILGKSNLSQWANFRSNSSISGWSALGGQVRNPHMLDRSPCGSSSGSGAAVAASLAAAAVGTETNGSIICPSNVNGVVGFKPSVGLVSQQYIVPISSSQDTAGPMTKTVKGAAMMLTAMATGAAKKDYVLALDGEILQGARIGVLRFSEGSNADIKGRFNEALAVLKEAGAELIEIDTFEPSVENFRGKAYELLKFEFKATLDKYLMQSPAALPVRSLEALIAFNETMAETELALFDQSVFEESVQMAGLESSAYQEARTDVQKATREDGLDRLLKEYDVQVLVSPSGPVASRVDPVNGDVWPEWAGAGYMAAMAGYPHISVPMGTVHGVPIGFSFMGAKDQDALVLSFGFSFEQRTGWRTEPHYLKNAEERPEIAKAMQRY